MTTTTDSTSTTTTTEYETTSTSTTTTTPTTTTSTTTTTTTTTTTESIVDVDFGEEAVDDIVDLIDDLLFAANVTEVSKGVSKAQKNFQKLVKKILQHNKKLAEKDGCTFETPSLIPSAEGCDGLVTSEMNLDGCAYAFGKHCKKESNKFVDRLVKKYLTKGMNTVAEAVGC